MIKAGLFDREVEAVHIIAEENITGYKPVEPFCNLTRVSILKHKNF